MAHSPMNPGLRLARCPPQAQRAEWEYTKRDLLLQVGDLLSQTAHAPC